MKNLCIGILLSIIISGCHNVPVWKYDIFKRPPGDKPYPKLYIQGWQDGCESGAEASANYLFRWKYKYKQNWQLIQTQDYRSGWEDAYNFCRKYVLQHNLKTYN